VNSAFVETPNLAMKSAHWFSSLKVSWIEKFLVARRSLYPE